MTKQELLKELIELIIDNPCMGEYIDYQTDDERRAIYYNEFKDLSIDELQKELDLFKETL